VTELRWPILVMLDAGGDDLTDLEERVARHLGLSQEARNAVDPDSDRRFYRKRLEQALEDLHQADAIDLSDDGASILITAAGRRLDETRSRALPVIVPSARPSSPPEPSPTEARVSVGDWVIAFLDGLPHA
jgi:hypothetical protein